MFPLREDSSGNTERDAHRSGVGTVPVVGTSLPTLWWWLPGVLRVTELALRQIVESFLLTAQHLELVLAFVGVDLRRVDRHGFWRPFSTEQPSQETHQQGSYPECGPPHDQA